MPGLWLGAESRSASVTTAEKRSHPFRDRHTGRHRFGVLSASMDRRSDCPHYAARVSRRKRVQQASRKALDAPQNALPQAGLDDRGVSGSIPEGVVRGPDISQLSPQERADRLFNRVMVLAGEGKTDSVLFFADGNRSVSHASPAERRPALRPRPHRRGWPVPAPGQAQADTILLENPRHLLGLILGARVASLREAAAKR